MIYIDCVEMRRVIGHGGNKTVTRRKDDGILLRCSRTDSLISRARAHFNNTMKVRVSRRVCACCSVYIRTLRCVIINTFGWSEHDHAFQRR